MRRWAHHTAGAHLAACFAAAWRLVHPHRWLAGGACAACPSSWAVEARPLLLVVALLPPPPPPPPSPSCCPPAAWAAAAACRPPHRRLPVLWAATGAGGVSLVDQVSSSQLLAGLVVAPAWPAAAPAPGFPRFNCASAVACKHAGTEDWRDGGLMTVRLCLAPLLLPRCCDCCWAL